MEILLNGMTVMRFHVSAILHFRPNSGSEAFQGQGPLWEAEEDRELFTRHMHLCTSHKISSSWNLSVDSQIKNPRFKKPRSGPLLVSRQAMMKKTHGPGGGEARSPLRGYRCEDIGGKSEAGTDQQLDWMRHYRAEPWGQQYQRNS